MRVERKAERFAARWWRRRGFSVRNVARDREHRGYDLLARKGRRLLKIEVKGCRREWQVPDFHSTEVNALGIVADFLCVVYYLEGRRPFACVLPRAQLPRSAFDRLGRFRLASRFKNAAAMRPYVNPAL